MNIYLKILYLVFFSVLIIPTGFMDPINPPPPPPVTSFTYLLMDEFRDCGPQDNIAKYCNEYYLKQKVVAGPSGTTVFPEEFVCGMDTRCTEGVACVLGNSNPIDNNRWQSVPLSDAWFCPSGYGVAQMHEPGVLDPLFDTISFSGSSVLTSQIAFIDNREVNVFFNSYIPACVNRIPMMNLNLDLSNTDNNQLASTKTGIYAIHETLDYDATPMGGMLENFNIPSQNHFRVFYELDSNLKTYRMWSFRERFVEGLDRVINQKNLNIPGNINVDALPVTSPQDFDEIYFSRDFMMGSFNVEDDGGFPVGDDVIQFQDVSCNIDVTDLNLPYLSTNLDLQTNLNNAIRKNEIIERIKSLNLCGLNQDSNIENVQYTRSLSTTFTDFNDKNLVFNLSDVSFSNMTLFEGWMNNNRAILSSRLRNSNILGSDPVENIITIYSINTINDPIVSLNVQTAQSKPYNGFAEINVVLSYSISTESSWNWRALRDLSLTNLARCLYNWDECLLNERNEPGVPWTMYEIADLGYGPRMDSLAYVWSEQFLLDEYGITFGFHFDGARGSNDLQTLITVYKECSVNDQWVSEEGHYACLNGLIYKCHYGLSGDEIQLGNVLEANFGQTIQSSEFAGYVCRNTAPPDAPVIPKWNVVMCS